jgi:hypothetical protein
MGRPRSRRSRCSGSHPAPGLLAATVLAAGAVGACAERTPEEAAVHQALDETLAALAASDHGRLWELSPEETRTTLLDLHRLLHEALGAVDEVYAGPERETARAAVGRDLVLDIPPGSPDAGPRLLARIVAVGAIRLDESAIDGVRAGKALVDPESAIIHTPAGEEFAFVREGDRWAPRIVHDLLDSERKVTVLRENARAVLALRDARREAWRRSDDPREPQGSYNLARKALDAPGGPDARALYALLDDEARSALAEAMTLAREAQKSVQRRTFKKDREDAYAGAGLTRYVEAESDEALFRAWVEGGSFVPPLPDRSDPASIEGDPASGEATVVTSAGGRVPMRRDAKGYWHLGGLAEVLRTALVEPVRKALEPPAPPPGTPESAPRP